MLKIKDNVDLKELEKYGMFKSSFMPYYKYILDNCATLHISEATRELSIDIDVDRSPFYDEIYTFDIIYTLIQAGLIEKVEK